MRRAKKPIKAKRATVRPKAKSIPRIAVPAPTFTIAAGCGVGAALENDCLTLTQRDGQGHQDTVVLTSIEARALFDEFGDWARGSRKQRFKQPPTEFKPAARPSLMTAEDANARSASLAAGIAEMRESFEKNDRYNNR